MGWPECRQSIESLWTANWTTTPTKYDNDGSFVQPGTQNIVRQPWVALYIQELTASRASLGQMGANIAVHRHIGLLTLQIFTDLNIGTNLGLSLANQAKEIWRDRELTLNAYLGATGETIRFLKEPEIKRVGDDRHGWFQYNLKAEFIYDEIN